jgi:hypothetical protein
MNMMMMMMMMMMMTELRVVCAMAGDGGHRLASHVVYE